MQGFNKRKTVIGLLVIAAVASVTLLNSYARQSSTAADLKWPDRVVSNFHAFCIKEIRRSKTKSPVVHQAVCDCQVSEVKRWLVPSDLSILLAATKGRNGLREMVVHSRTLSRSEQTAFVKRTENYRESTLRRCFRAGLDAALAERDVR